MNKNTRIYDRWQGYSVADCDCQFCVHYRGKKRPCPLEVCCCAEERAEALRREQAAAGGATSPAEAMPCRG